MEIDTFWNLIKKSRRGASDDCDALAANLTTRLEKLAPAEIISFHQHLWDLLGESYRRDLWAVADIINGGCSDDGFEYFRCWLISQGKEFFEMVLVEPETAAKRVRDEDVECEPLLYASLQAYENKTGHEMPKINISHSDEPKGEQWQEEDLERLYPKLCKRFR